MTPVIVAFVIMAVPALRTIMDIPGTIVIVRADLQGCIVKITLQPMTHAIQIPVKTVQRAPGTIITRETTIVHVQEDTRAKTANIMLVIMKQHHMIPVIPTIPVIMAVRAIITMDTQDTIARALVDILDVIATAIMVYR